MAASDTTENMPRQNRIRAFLEGRNWPNLTLPQTLVILGLVFGGALTLDFTQRIQESRRIQDEAAALQLEVDALLTEQAVLLEQREYVQSDEYVEEWAHKEGRYVRNGEVLVIPVVPDDGTALETTPVSIEPMPPRPVWTLWLALFFD